MSSEEDKDKNKDKERLYPWGAGTGTYKILMILLAFNVVAASLLFITQVEIPFLQGEDVGLGDILPKAFGQVSMDGGVDVPVVDTPEVQPPEVVKGENTRLILICMFIIAFNFILVWFSIRIGMWLVRIRVHCIKIGWFKICWIFVFLEWVTWTITFAATIITLVVILKCWWG